MGLNKANGSNGLDSFRAGLSRLRQSQGGQNAFGAGKISTQGGFSPRAVNKEEEFKPGNGQFNLGFPRIAGENGASGFARGFGKLNNVGGRYVGLA